MDTGEIVVFLPTTPASYGLSLSLSNPRTSQMPVICIHTDTYYIPVENTMFLGGVLVFALITPPDLRQKTRRASTPPAPRYETSKSQEQVGFNFSFKTSKPANWCASAARFARSPLSDGCELFSNQVYQDDACRQGPVYGLPRETSRESFGHTFTLYERRQISFTGALFHNWKLHQSDASVGHPPACASRRCQVISPVRQSGPSGTHSFWFLSKDGLQQSHSLVCNL